MMSFQHPEYNWGFLLLLIPILIHLLKLRREQVVYFPGVFRLKEVLKSTRKNKQLKHWAVLAARLLLLSAIVLAFSKPFWIDDKADVANPSKNSWVVWDNSPSMWKPNESGDIPAETAKRAWSGALNDAEDWGDFQLRWTVNSGNSNIQKEIEEIVPSESYSDLRQLLPQTSDENGNLYIVTDGAKDALDNLHKDIPKSWNKNVVLYESTPIYNVSLDSAWSFTESQGKIGVSLSRNNSSIADTVVLKIFDSVRLVGTESLIFQKNVTKVFASLEIGEVMHGPFRLGISKDAYRYDNQLYCYANNSQKVNVHGGVEMDVKISQLLDVLSDRVEKVDSVKEAKVCLKVSENIEKDLFQMEKWASKGISSILFPTTDKPSFPKDWGNIQYIKAKTQIDHRGFNQWPFRAAFSKDIDLGNDIPALNGVFTFGDVVPSDWQPVLNSEKGQPVLLLKRLDKANIWMFLSSYQEEKSNWVISPWFLTSMGQLIFSSNESNSQVFAFLGSDNYRVPESLELTLDQIAEIKQGESTWSVPTVSMGSDIALDFSGLVDLQSGHYQIENKKSNRVISVGLNAPRCENLNAFYSKSELESLGYRVIEADETLRLEGLDDKGEDSSDTWKLLAVLLVLMEMWLLKRRLETNT